MYPTNPSSGNVNGSPSRETEVSRQTSEPDATARAAATASEQEVQLPLPRSIPGSTLRVPKSSSRPKLQSTATTAVSLTDIHTQSYDDGSRETFASQATPLPYDKYFKGFGSVPRFQGHGEAEAEADSASTRSYAPTLEAGGDVESLLGEILGSSSERRAWRFAAAGTQDLESVNFPDSDDEESLHRFEQEFDQLDDSTIPADSEGKLLHVSWVQ